MPLGQLLEGRVARQSHVDDAAAEEEEDEDEDDEHNNNSVRQEHGRENCKTNDKPSMLGVKGDAKSRQFKDLWRVGHIIRTMREMNNFGNRILVFFGFPQVFQKTNDSVK